MREGRDRGNRVNSGHSAHGWSISLMWASSKSWELAETEARKLSRTFRRGHWAWSECLKMFPLFISVAWRYQAIFDVFYQRQEGQVNRVVAAGNLVRTRITRRHWLSMQWVHLLRDSCSIRIISVQLYLLYLALVLEIVWESCSPPNIPIIMKGDTQGRTQQQLWTNKLVSMHLVYIFCLLEITFSGMPSSLQRYLIPDRCCE